MSQQTELQQKPIIRSAHFQFFHDAQRIAIKNTMALLQDKPEFDTIEIFGKPKNTLSQDHLSKLLSQEMQHNDEDIIYILQQCALIFHNKRCTEQLREELGLVMELLRSSLKRQVAQEALQHYRPNHSHQFQKLINMIENEKLIEDKISLDNLKLKLSQVDDTYDFLDLISIYESLMSVPYGKSSEALRKKLEKAKRTVISLISWNISPFLALPSSSEQAEIGPATTEEDKKTTNHSNEFYVLAIGATLFFIVDGINGVSSIIEILIGFSISIPSIVTIFCCLLFAAISSIAGWAFELKYVADELGVKLFEIKSYITYCQQQLDELNTIYEKIIEELDCVTTHEQLKKIKDNYAHCETLRRDIEQLQLKAYNAKNTVSESTKAKVTKWSIITFTALLTVCFAFFSGTSAALFVIATVKGILITATLTTLLTLGWPLAIVVIGAGLLMAGIGLWLFARSYGSAISKVIDKICGNPRELIDNFITDKKHQRSEREIQLKIETTESKLKQETLPIEQSKTKQPELLQQYREQLGHSKVLVEQQKQEIERLRLENEKLKSENAELKAASSADSEDQASHSMSFVVS